MQHPLTHRPFEGLRITGTREGTAIVAAPPSEEALAAQRAAIARMHTIAQNQQRTERALFSVVFDTEGRAHDAHTGRYRARPSSTRHLSRYTVWED